MKSKFFKPSLFGIFCTIILTALQTSIVCGANLPGEYSEILRKALAVSPEVKVISASLKSKKTELRTANLGPQSEIEFEIEELGIDGESLLDSEMTLLWSREIEPSALKRRKKQVALSSLEKAKALYANDLLLYIQEVSVSYFNVASRHMELDLSRETESLAKEMLEVARNRVSAGAAPGLEQERSEMEYDMALIDVTRAEKELYSARVKLASFLDEEEDELPPLDGKDSTLKDRCKGIQVSLDERHPLIEAARHSIEEAKLESSILNIESKPLLKTSFGFKHMGESSDDSLIVGVSIPLGTSRRNQSKKESALWLLEEEKKSSIATKVQLTRNLEQTILTAKAVSHEFNAIETRILPAAERIFQSVKEGYLRGELRYTDLLIAKQSLVFAAKKRVTALSDLRLALLYLEVARGGSMEMKKAIMEVLK